MNMVGSDPFLEMAALGRELEEIQKQEARIADEKAAVHAKMRVCAARIAPAPVQTPRAPLVQGPTIPATLPKVFLSSSVAHHRPKIGLVKKTAPQVSRLDQLLVALRESPGAEYSELAQVLYGVDDKAARLRIAGIMMQAKGTGLVEMVAQGRYRVKEVGAVAK